MAYIFERIQKTCSELKKLEYSQSIEIDLFEKLEGHFLTPQDAHNHTGWEKYTSGEKWGGRDYNCWFKTSVTVPKTMGGRTIAIHVQTNNEGWDAINPQFILFLDGEHIQGLDVNHREVIITRSAESGRVYQIDLHAYAGMIGDEKTCDLELQVKLVVLDEEVRGLFFDLQVPLWVCEKLGEEDIRRIEMLDFLNQSVNLIDFRKNSNSFIDSVLAARDFLKVNFYDQYCKGQPVTASVIGHTHIDVAWLWTVAQTRQKSR